MLAYVLAWAIALGSVAIYLAAFFFPEIHRKYDFIWSGVGLFYALVLWVFARRITGGLLLGHVASVALLGWFGWQTFSLRRQLTPQAQQTQIPSAEAVKINIQEQVTKLSLSERLTQLQKGVAATFSGVKDQVQQTVGKKTPDPKTAVTSPTTKDKPVVEIIDERTPISEQSAVTPVITVTQLKTPPPEQPTTTDTEARTESVPELIPPLPPSPELVEAAKESTEDKTPPLPVVFVSPSAELAPRAETQPNQLPPNPSIE